MKIEICDILIRAYMAGPDSVGQGGKAVTIHWTGLLDWTTGLTFDLKCSKKIMFYLCEKNYIDRAHGFFARSTVQQGCR